MTHNNHPHEPFRVLCFGMGAIGTYIGGSLAHAGCDVVFVERSEVIKTAQLLRLKISTPSDEILVNPVKVSADIKNLLTEKKFDVAILAVKAFDTIGVVNSLEGVKTIFPPILCLQNGVENEQVIEEKLGKGSVIGGSITSAVGRNGLGNVRLEKLRGVGIETGTPLSERILEEFNLAGLNAIGYSVRVDMKWSKMLTNLLVNASAAILNWSPARILNNPITFKIEVLQLREALAVMKKLGIRVIDLPGTPVKMLVTLLDVLPLNLGRVLIGTALAKGRGKKTPSLHIDLQAGRTRSEVEFLNGAVVRYGEKADIPTPVNRVLTEILMELADGKKDKLTYANNPEMLLKSIEAAS
jgi:2-dehydropantoate 2-reductase